MRMRTHINTHTHTSARTCCAATAVLMPAHQSCTAGSMSTPMRVRSCAPARTARSLACRTWGSGTGSGMGSVGVAATGSSSAWQHMAAAWQHVAAAWQRLAATGSNWQQQQQHTPRCY